MNRAKFRILAFTATILFFIISIHAIAFSKSLFGKSLAQSTNTRHTEVSINGGMFLINGQPTYKGRTWNSLQIEGLLLNSRMVQGIFDDLNRETRDKWKYPDTGKWDPKRSTNEFVMAMAEWRQHGLLAFTLNLQGGSPQGYSKEQPWHNSAFTSKGKLRRAYTKRLEKVLDRADELGMVVILGIFFFGQDQRLADETAVKKAVDNTINWLFDKCYTNILIEINNECNVRYDHAILKPDRVHELILRVKNHRRNGRRFLVSTSYGGGRVPDSNVVRTADFLLLHGNGVKEPQRIIEMVEQTRNVPGYRPKPILFNEDDHYDFDQRINNMFAAISSYASWGFFDFRRSGEGFEEGFQSVPVNWSISSERKRNFFEKLKEITGERGSDDAEKPSLVEPNTILVKLAGDFKFTEGPAVDAKGNIYFTDIPNNRIHKWSVRSQLSIVRENSGGANGLFFDKTGNLLACEGGNRRLVSIDAKGEVTVLADRYDNKKLNSPNDLWPDPKGGIYFTDPRYGKRDNLEQDGEHVYYLTPDRKKLIRVIDDMVRPNGLIGTPDGRLLYVTDPGDKQTFVYTINANGTLSDKKLFAPEGSDGMTIDNEGNVYLTGNAVSVYNSNGNKIETIEIPERPANVCFGGKDKQKLFITARTSLYSVKMRIKGL